MYQFNHFDMLIVKQFQFSLFGVNTYLVYDEATKEAAVIDPAMNDAAEENKFSAFVDSVGIHITQIINTHLHLDHCFGINYVKGKYGVNLKAHANDAILGEIIDQQYQMFGMKPKGYKLVIDEKLEDHDIIQIGESKLEVIASPGHTLGGIALYCKQDKILFTGDTIFQGSVGRTDLPGGNHTQLIRSIKSRILSLPDDVRIFPGHGPSTTIAYEKSHNPYV